MPPIAIRAARPEDRSAIQAIQQASPEASGWDPFGYDVTVAETGGTVVAFLVVRRTAPQEVEILNLAVAPSHRRGGVARSLLRPLQETLYMTIYLEVRESNAVARELYESVGFKEVCRRPQYYSNPSEACIVMKFCSC